MTAKEWIFENYPQVKEEWNKTGHDDNYMVRMMEEYHQAMLKLLDIANVRRQSELLNAFLEWRLTKPYSDFQTREHDIKEFLEAFNCA